MARGTKRETTNPVTMSESDNIGKALNKCLQQTLPTLTQSSLTFDQTVALVDTVMKDYTFELLGSTTVGTGVQYMEFYDNKLEYLGIVSVSVTNIKDHRQSLLFHYRRLLS